MGSDSPPLIEAMTRSMSHRGPDGHGTKCFAGAGSSPPAALGHRRLSIIDVTSRGAQPMRLSLDDRYWVTFNGELYNFRELRRELEASGMMFRSNSDTEVLLGMYARHGASMLDRINGIFAFGIWDALEGSLFLARDRLGVKPLYYAFGPQSFVFASEVKALLPAIPAPQLEHRALADYLSFLWVPDPDTLFAGVHKLPPGHFATYHRGHLSVKQYWDVVFAPDSRHVAEWAPEIRSAVRDAVSRQLVSDVPIGAFLSGGIDSSAIVAEMAESIDHVTTYTVGFSGNDLAHEIVPDDLGYARLLARTVGADYHEQLLNADVVDLLPRLVWHMDEPVADPACITTYLICRAARSNLAVILSGMGGDEIFAGYPRHLAAALTRPLDVLPRSFRSLGRRALGHLTMGRPGRTRTPRRNLMKLARGIDCSAEDRYLTYCSYYQADELARIVSPELRATLGDHDPWRWHREYFDRARQEHWLNRMLYVDMKTFLPCLNLAYTDKMSMAASTEVRVPLLDDELVDLAARVPPCLKLRGTTRKYVFKKSMEGVLPPEIIWRPKAGFGAPVRSWIGTDLRPMVDDLLSPERLRSRGLLDPKQVRQVIQSNDKGLEDNTLRIWAMLTLELWQQTFLDRPPSRVTA